MLKKYNKICKRVEKLLKIKFDSELVYCDNDKYIKTKIKVYGDSVNTNFQDKKMPKKSTIQVFIYNNARFSCQSKEKVLSANAFERFLFLSGFSFTNIIDLQDSRGRGRVSI